MVKKRSSVEESLPRQRHYIASRGVRTAIYLYAASVSETHHVLRYSTPYVRFFIFLDGAKIRSFIETTKLFLRKFHFMSNFSLKTCINQYFVILLQPNNNILDKDYEETGYKKSLA